MNLPVGKTLRDAGLPSTFFDDLPTELNAQAYFSLWRAMDNACRSDELPLLMEKALSVEVFSPPLFAAVCSINLRQAAERVAHYKSLTGPLAIIVRETDDAVVLSWRWSPDLDLPLSFVLSELMFWVFISRTCTRMPINPLKVTVPVLPTALSQYTNYFCAPIDISDEVSITFSAVDASTAFLTVNDAIWNAFEPELRHRLHEHSLSQSMTDRTRAALLRAIPAADVTAQHVATALGLSARTLQRRLHAEGTNFKALLNATRAQLACHYLVNSELPLAEISYLLGYQEPSSFNRAFRKWTRTTPDRYRDSNKESPKDE